MTLPSGARRRAAIALVVAVWGCRGRATETGPLRLVDLYRADAVEGRAAAVPRPSFEWWFDGSAPPAFQAGAGVAGLAVREGRLAGRAKTAIPIVALSRTPPADRDAVHEIHVRLRATGGTNVSAAFRTVEKVDLAQEAALLPIIPWPFNTPLIADGQAHTYVLRGTAVVPNAARHLLLRPTDAAGATFEVESVRVVSRREHLSGVPSGLGWQGLSDVFREALAARAPERLRFDLDLPPQARLDVALGTMEEGPVTFRVGVKRAGDDAEVTLLERTVTSAHRWEPARIDLARYGGEKVALSLALASETPGALGFWGTPVVRGAPPRARSTAATPRPRGVIFIWADTLRRDHLQFYGYSRPTAPVLARMAGEGAVFEDCVAQASWTKASGPALMTSFYPTSHTVQSFNDVLPSSATTLAEVYRQAGYATLSLISIPFVGKFSSMHQGFEELHEPGAYPEIQSINQKSARAQVDRLLPWLDAHRDTPFFVLLHVRDPHSPHKPYPPYDTMWADPARAAEHARQLEAARPFVKNPLMRRFGMPARAELVEAGVDPEAYVAYERDWYDGSIRAMDAEIGRLREHLAALGLDRSTLVAFVADHGEEFLEHGRTFHQQSVYGELANVPLFLWWPGVVPAGARIAPTVQTIDLMPTLLELSGLMAPAGVQGASLLPLLQGRNAPWNRPAVIEASGRADPASTENNVAFAIIVDGFKLVERPGTAGGAARYELYDHRCDPLDQHDIAAQHPDVVARLARELEAWRRMATQARLKPDAALTGAMNAEDLERLRALGYVQ